MSGRKVGLLIFCLFFVITFPAFKALLHPGMLTSHDGEGHIIRMFEFNTALDDGNFPVRWSKRLNWGLGYPYFNFNYPLTYYLTFILGKFGLDLLTAFKSILLFSFPLSGFFCYLWLKQHFGKIESVVGGLFYTLIPYHFLNVYVRGNIAETLALTVIPLGFFAVDKLNQKTTLRNSIRLSLALSAIILFHNITALIFLPILFVYGLLISTRISFLRWFCLSFVFSILMTCFFWLPALYDKQFIIIDQVFPLYYAKQFPAVKDLIYSVWGYGGSKTGPGQMSVQIGLLHLFIFLVSSIILILNIKKLPSSRLACFFFVLSIGAFFMMTEFSKQVWDLIKPLQYLQFPWRLLAIIALTVPFLSAFSLSLLSRYLPKKGLILVSIFLIAGLFFFNRNHWNANEYYSLPTYWFQDKPYHSTTTVDGEHTPVWQKENQPDSITRFEVISGNTDVKSLVWKTNYHQFDIQAKTESTILDRTVYFPGWMVYLDGKSVPNISKYSPTTKGLIGFNVPPGKHTVEVKLQEPILNKLADTISVVSLILVVAILGLNRLFFKKVFFS